MEIFSGMTGYCLAHDARFGKIALVWRRLGRKSADCPQGGILENRPQSGDFALLFHRYRFMDARNRAKFAKIPATIQNFWFSTAFPRCRNRWEWWISGMRRAGGKSPFPTLSNRRSGGCVLWKNEIHVGFVGKSVDFVENPRPVWMDFHGKRAISH